MLLIFALISICFAILRFVIPVEGKVNKKDIYKDLAHIWVGVLIGYAIGTGERDVWLLFVGLTAIEVGAFLLRRK